jgi:glucosyl-3-phosphoglycerate phosphatase
VPTKRVHFIRHAQSQHNARADVVADETPVRMDPSLRDAALTDLGHGQARALASEIAALNGIEIVVVTPLTRAIQTMRHAFAHHHAPRLVHHLHREHQASFCDIGRPPAALAEDFPDLAFDHLPDPWWHHDPAHSAPYVVESMHQLDARVQAFRDWLAARPEREIAVVGHGTFLNRMTGHVFANAARVAVDL